MRYVLMVIGVVFLALPAKAGELWNGIFANNLSAPIQIVVSDVDCWDRQDFKNNPTVNPGDQVPVASNIDYSVSCFNNGTFFLKFDVLSQGGKIAEGELLATSCGWFNDCNCAISGRPNHYQPVTHRCNPSPAGSTQSYTFTLQLDQAGKIAIVPQWGLE